MVVFHSDHGYALGERGSWEKMSNEELTLRVPLMIAVPWMHASVGRKSGAVVELLDIYPTVLSALGVSADETLDGSSLLPMKTKPELTQRQPHTLQQRGPPELQKSPDTSRHGTFAGRRTWLH